ncbi:MAG: tRNA epoxyqueuosine(34) reductase QueG [Mariprofundaceae bacterium]
MRRRLTQSERKLDIPAEMPLNVQNEIRAEAKRYGFDICRFSHPKISSKHRQALQNWLDAGMHGDMDWMAEETRLARRMKPESMLSEVKTVITLGMRHQPPAYGLNEANAAKSRGVIAVYAHGDDYHDIIKKRLKALARSLDQMLGKHQQRVYVDTAPVLEHALAESSGLGWQGKHSLTLNREHGSWFMLAELFTSAIIDTDLAASNHCGTCDACMHICPTQAIVAPYVVDARLCISYLTIEYGGFIPLKLRKLMGNRIFGCDDCQAVCPWNKHISAPADDLLDRRLDNVLPELADLLMLDDKAFRIRFRKSPIKRTGRAKLLRNVCIAVGNSENRAFIPLLLILLDDVEALIRGHAAWALAQLCKADHADAILSALQSRCDVEFDRDVMTEIRLATSEINVIKAV